jgi:two-component system, chemotaxis family, CheB/CheR fusion protein
MSEQTKRAIPARPKKRVAPFLTGVKLDDCQAPTNKRTIGAAGELEHLLDSTNIPLLLVDRRLCIQRFTPSATSLFSLLPTDIGRPIRDLSQRFSDPAFLPDIYKVLEGIRVLKKEVTSSEGRHYIRETLPYRAGDGSVEGVVITFADVAAEALQEARLYAESIVNTVREPLLVLDRDLFVQSVNQSFSNLFRISNQEIIGESLTSITSGIWNTPGLVGLLNRVHDTGVPMEDFELVFESPWLGTRALRLNARPLPRSGDRADLILLGVEDLTERRSIEKVLKQNEERLVQEEQVRQRQLELTNALRVSTVGELATGLAHELNQPLASISNMVEACTQYIRAGTINPVKLLELLSAASSEAIRAAGIVAHLRSFVDKGEPQLEPVDLAEIVNHVPHLLLRELERTRVSLRMEITSSALPVQADRIQIEQVIVNLLQNAMDSIREAERPQRVIELSARSVKGTAVVSVRDTGTGVSSASAEKIFEAFFTTKQQGLGMGLCLSRSILEAHRGRIWMEAPEDGGPGTVVRFAIPLKRPNREHSQGAR